jgi:holliday junction DNA helicase RuvA
VTPSWKLLREISESEEVVISRLKGIIEHVAGNIVTLDVHGVGYEVYASAGCLARCVKGEEAAVVIYTDVKEDLIRLYGFDDHLEKQVFLLLTRVKGVGAKSASDIISKVEKVDLLRTIAAGDTAKLQLIKGIGKKTAERIVVELKDKVGEYVIEGQVSRLSVEREVVTPFSEATEALMALGFSKKDAERAVQNVEAANRSASDPGEIVREALRYI